MKIKNMPGWRGINAGITSVDNAKERMKAGEIFCTGTGTLFFYDEVEDEFFIVFTDNTFDAIKGMWSSCEEWLLPMPME